MSICTVVIVQLSRLTGTHHTITILQTFLHGIHDDESVMNFLGYILVLLVYPIAASYCIEKKKLWRGEHRARMPQVALQQEQQHKIYTHLRYKSA